ncbi:MAG: diacylglycerol kinase family protein [Planctomycetes bacterium]|nr:diacylglycerol kinase family protein [Planctomycetota bacterium]
MTGQTTVVTGPDHGTAHDPALQFLHGGNPSFTIWGRVQSFRHAWYGLALMLRSQHNAWLHAFASICIVGAGLVFGLTSSEWCWIILAIMAVWTAEALNTALEFLADAATSEFHPLVKCAKDVAAGGVLISAFGSVIIGLLVLGPPLLDFLGRLW